MKMSKLSTYQAAQLHDWLQFFLAFRLWLISRSRQKQDFPLLHSRAKIYIKKSSPSVNCPERQAESSVSVLCYYGE
jgi:hypothetical protein